MEIFAGQRCLGCGCCATICPIYQTMGANKFIGPSQFCLLSKPTHHLNILKDLLFLCCGCEYCKEVCPSNIQIPRVLMELRAKLTDNVLPKNIRELVEKITTSRNIFGMSQDDRAIWSMFQETPIEINSSAKVAYFVGCQSSYSGISGKIAENFAKILSGAKIDFTILGPDEWCCGFPLIIRGALKEEVHIFFENNIHKLEKLGVKEVILSCAGCFRTWRLEYQKFGKIPFKITHYSEFIAKLIAEGHIKPKPLNKIVTYHDPCDLGRICGIFDPPRKIISSIPEITFKELPNNKENSICCGSGGLLKFVHPTIANKILHKKIEDFLAVHPDIVITSCVTCFNTFKELEEKLRIEVWDITDLIVGRSTTK